MASKLIVKRSIILSETEIIDINVWQVLKSKQIPDGIKYSVNYRKLKKDEWISKIRVDNSESKGHHLHIDNKEKDFKFVSIEETIRFILSKR